MLSMGFKKYCAEYCFKNEVSTIKLPKLYERESRSLLINVWITAFENTKSNLLETLSLKMVL